MKIKEKIISILDIKSENKRKKFLIYFFTSTALLSLLAFGVKGFSDGRITYSIIISVFFILAFANLIILKFFSKIKLSAHIMLFLMFSLELALFCSIGTGTTGLFWFYVFPPLAISMLGNKNGTIYSLILIAVTFIILAVKPDFLTNTYSNEIIIRFIFTYSVVGLLINIFEYSRNTAYKAYLSNLDEIKEKNDELQTAEEELRQNNEELRSLNENIQSQKDIIENKNRELQKYFTAIEQSEATIVFTDIKGSIEYANPQFTKLTGYTVEEAIGKNPRVLKSGKTPKSTFKELWDTILNGQTWRGELVNRKKDGTEFYEQAIITPIKNENGEITDFVAVKEDITELKRAENEIKEKSKELHKYFTAIEQSEATIVFTDINGDIEYANPQFIKITGYTVEEALGKNPRILKSGKTPNETYTNLWNTISNGQTWSGEFINQKKDGTEFYERAIITPIKNENGEITDFVAVKEDITELKKIETELKERDERLHTIINAVQVGIAIIDTEDFRIQYINPAAEKVIGKTSKDLQGTRCSEIFAGSDYTNCPVMKKDDAAIYNELFVTNNRNQNIPIIKTVTPIFINGKKHLLESFVDISDLKEAQQIIEEKTKQQEILIDNIPAGIFYKNENLQYVLLNNSYSKMLNIPLKEILGKKYSELFVSKESIEFENLDRKILETKKPVFNIENQHINRNGSVSWVFVSKVPYFDENNNVRGIVGIVQDVTERKNQEQIILEQKRQFENTINNMVDIFIKVDLNGIFLQVSPSITSEFGVSNIDEVIGTNLSEWSEISYEQRKYFIQTLLEKQKITNFRFVFVRKNGEKQNAELNARLIYNRNGQPNGFEAIVRNITERLKFEEELKKLNTNLSSSLETTQKQKTIIDDANKEILAGINYASTIQKSMLTSEDILNAYLSDYFLIYKPREIVSGDFYYVNKIENHLIIAIADCTGHGVAGAFITVLGITYLHDTLTRNITRHTNTVLEIVRERFKKTFATFGSDSKNGMDIALCALNLDTLVLQYSGANLPLWIVRKGELIEHKATRCPIGFYPVDIDFVQNEIQLEKNDTIYMFSDGIYDQLSDISFKKYQKNQFKTLILENTELSLENQKQKILDNFKNWKGAIQQTDDITVLGFKI